MCHWLLHTLFVSFWLSQLVEHVSARTEFARVSNPSQPIRVFKKELVTHLAVLPLSVDEQKKKKRRSNVGPAPLFHLLSPAARGSWLVQFSWYKT